MLFEEKCLFLCVIVLVYHRSISTRKSSISPRTYDFQEAPLHRSVADRQPRFVADSPRNDRLAVFLPPRSSSPTSWDWRESGAITKVKAQALFNKLYKILQGADCPYSSWAFAAIGAIEAHHQLHGGRLVDLSVQQVLDCAQDTRQCFGGFVDDAFDIIMKQGGLQTDESYPFVGRTNNSCRLDEKKIKAIISGYHVFVDVTEEEMKMLVSQLGPLTVTIDGSVPSFWSYAGEYQFSIAGVYNDPRCGRILSHSMLLVGYGTDDNEGDYWLLKNSFGETWGEDGYIRMARNREDPCCVACYAMLPYVPM